MKNEFDFAIEPAKYFEVVKEKKNQNTDEVLDKFYESCIVLLDKYRKTGQELSMRKLMFIINCIPKERELLKLGYDIFIYKDDIEEYINSVRNKVIKIIELKNYSREIPDELVDTIEQTKDIFNGNFYVLFTDYTGKEERRVEKARREKDPILFGVFKQDRELNDRFYYLGDWEDEYCDLTLEKLINERSTDIVNTIRTPINADELMEECNRLVNNKIDKSKNIIRTVNIEGNEVVSDQFQSIVKNKKHAKQNIFKNIKSFFSKGK